MMYNFDRCAWFHKSDTKDQSRLELLYSCILSAKKIQLAMTMLSQFKKGSQDMPGGPKRKPKPKSIDDKKMGKAKKSKPQSSKRKK